MPVIQQNKKWISLSKTNKQKPPRRQEHNALYRNANYNFRTDRLSTFTSLRWNQHVYLFIRQDSILSPENNSRSL